MTDISNNHPNEEMLLAFLDGTLLMGFSVAVSAHLESCEQCREAVSGMTEKVSTDWYENIGQDWDMDFSGVIDEIVENEEAPVIGSKKTAAATTARIRDRRIELPGLLAELTVDLEWKEVAKGIYQGLVNLDPKTKFEFICMDPGSRVPMHTHLGREVMLVLDGDISDRMGEYAVGDFVLLGQKDFHGQVTEGGCICLFVTDAPLLFKEGIARLMNPINRIKHWLASR